MIKVNLMRLYDPKKRRYSRPDFIRVFLEGVNEATRRYTLGGRVVRFISNVLSVDEETFLEFNAVKIGMTPFPPKRAGFHCGGLVRCPVCCGVNGFVLGVVVRVGYRPTGSSEMRETPFRGHHPKHQVSVQN